MTSRFLLILGFGLLLSGCMVPQARFDEALAKNTLMESNVHNKDQELVKCSKRIQELEAANRALAAELAKSKLQVIEKDKELRENQAWAEDLIKQMKSIH